MYEGVVGQQAGGLAQDGVVEKCPRSNAVSTQTQTEFFDHAVEHHADFCDHTTKSREIQDHSPVLAPQDFMVHPPAPPQEEGPSHHCGEQQELLHARQVGQSTNVALGSVLQPVQGTIVHPAGLIHHSVVDGARVAAVGQAGRASSQLTTSRGTPRKTLTASQKLAIINMHKGKERATIPEIAQRFGVLERKVKQICSAQHEEKLLSTLQRPEKLSQEDRAALRRRMISKACTGKARLTVAQKLEIIKLHETSAGKTGVPAAQLAERYNVAERTIRKICCDKQRERLERFSLSDASIEGTRLCRDDLYPDLTRALLKWIEAQVHAAPGPDRPLTQSVILHRAVELGAELGLEEFKGSKGWMHRWMKRYNVRAIIDGSAMLPSAARAMKEAHAHDHDGDHDHDRDRDHDHDRDHHAVEADHECFGEPECARGMGMVDVAAEGGAMADIASAMACVARAEGDSVPVLLPGSHSHSPRQSEGLGHGRDGRSMAGAARQLSLGGLVDEGVVDRHAVSSMFPLAGPGSEL